MGSRGWGGGGGVKRAFTKITFEIQLYKKALLQS